MITNDTYYITHSEMQWPTSAVNSVCGPSSIYAVQCNMCFCVYSVDVTSVKQSIDFEDGEEIFMCSNGSLRTIFYCNSSVHCAYQMFIKASRW